MFKSPRQDGTAWFSLHFIFIGFNAKTKEEILGFRLVGSKINDLDSMQTHPITTHITSFLHLFDYISVIKYSIIFDFFLSFLYLFFNYFT